MKTLTIEDIRELKPCYDPVKYLPEDWSGTVLDILDIKDCSFNDKLWVVTHFLSDKVNRLFAVYCAKQAIALIENPDKRISVIGLNNRSKAANISVKSNIVRKLLNHAANLPHASQKRIQWIAIQVNVTDGLYEKLFLNAVYSHEYRTVKTDNAAIRILEIIVLL